MTSSQLFASRVVLAAFTGVALAASISGAANAQGSVREWFRQDRALSIYEEDDLGHGDSSYTQGLRFTWHFAAWDEKWNKSFKVMTFNVTRLFGKGIVDNATGACQFQISLGDGQSCGAVSLSFGQTEYTAADLLNPDVQPNGRPYAGYLFVAHRREIRSLKTETSSEIQLGVTGGPSLAREAQSLAHWAWVTTSAEPQGWDHQIKTVPHVTLINQWAYRHWSWCTSEAIKGCDATYDEHRAFDFTFRGEAIVGTLMTRASAGAVVRAGRRFPHTLGVDRISPTRSGTGSASRKANFWYMVFATGDGRLVGHNALISGSPLVDDCAGCWRDTSRISTEHVLSEWSWGAAAGVYGVSAVVQFVTRGREYTPNGGTHKFPAFSLTLNRFAFGGAESK